MTTDKHLEEHSDEDDDGLRTKREARQPIGYDPQREEAAQRARRAVEPGRPRE